MNCCSHCRSWVCAVVTLAFSASNLLATTVFAAPKTAARPNIIFLLTDDQRWDALGCTGNLIVQTPNIDRLASRGVLFRNGFVTTSICCVSRASVFSGQYQRRHQIGDFATPFTPAAWSNTYPALLKQHGYRTGFIGKFGVGNQMPTNSFDFWAGFPGQGNYFEKGDPVHLTHKMGESALAFLESSQTAQPFCLSISFKAPHSQDGAGREFPPDHQDEHLYDDVSIPVPKLASDGFFNAEPDFVRNSEGRARWEKRFATPEMFQQTVKDYYRLITGVDREVGRIMDELHKLNLDDNTVIVFSSDNGFFLGERGLAGKWLMYEESIRVPFIVVDPRMPEKRRGKKLDPLVLNIDLAPTILDYAGVKVPSTMQGRSLRPLAEDRRGAWRKDFYYEHHFGFGGKIPETEGVRTERWAYVRYVSANPVVERLYDLKSDPLEEHDLVADRRQRKMLNELRARWESYRESLK